MGEVIRLNGRIGFRGYTEKDIVSKDDGGVLTFSPTNIVDNKLTTNCKNTYITRFKYDESPEIKIHNGDILFVKTGSTLGKSALVTGLSEDATLNPQVVVMRTNNLNAEFLAAMLVTNAIISQVNSAKIGGAVPTLTETRIKDFDVAIPVSEAEKEQIGQFFSQLDHLITLHQRQPFLHSSPEISLTVQLIHPFYTSSWEQRKVGDLLIERNQQAPMSDEYPLMAFIASEGVAPKGERYDRSALVTDTVNKLYKKTEKGDFIYSSNNLETGSIGLNKYGKACISPVYSIFEPTGIADSDFLGRRLVRKDFINAMVKWRQGVIYGQWRIHESDFLKIEITVPSVEEQRKIGAYLDQLDHLITLHQRKFEKLTNVKKSMLEKMFPQNGSSYPEIRFKGFTDPWEQRKLGELSEKTFGGGTPNTSNNEYWNGDIPWFQSSDISDGKLFDIAPKKFISQDGLSKSAAQLIPENSIAIITRVGVGKLAFVPFSYTTSQDFLSLSRLKTEPFFTVYACYKKLQSELNAVQGTSIKGITKDELLAKQIMIPNYAEQRQIGAYFKSLDHLITLHQRELEKLQNIKKSMLEKMFV